MAKNIIVTGCLGFIGSYVTRQLLKNDYNVLGIDNETYAADRSYLTEFNNYKNFTYLKKDINDLNDLIDCEYIINTAAETHVDNSIINSDTFLKSNINGVHNLLRLIQTKNPMPCLIHFSTDEVYGDIVNGMHTELDILKPSNPYSATKASADMLISAWHRTYKVPYIIVRPSNNYGIGQHYEKFIPRACTSLSRNLKVPMHENGTPRRTWLHAEDTANAIICLINNKVVNDTFNISGNYEDTNWNVYCKIAKYFNLQNPIDYADLSITRPGQDVRYSIDDTKLRNLGWTNQKLFDNELMSIVEYYKNKEHK